MPIITRKGKLEDVSWIMDELREFALFYNTKKNLFPSDNFALNKIAELVTDHVSYVAYADEDPAGFIIGLFTPHLFNPEIRVLHELFWWVVPRYRGSRAGYMLLEDFMKYGEENADWINFSLEKQSPVKESVLLSRGFHHHETNYLKEIE